MMTPPTDGPKILYLLTSAGSSSFLRGQLRFLIDRGYRVTLGTCFTNSSGPPVTDDGVEVINIPFKREPSPLRDLISLVKTTRLVKQLRPQIVNASTPKAGLLGMLSAAVCRVPVRVYVVRGLRFETVKGPKKVLYWLLEWLTMRTATALLFNSESLAQLAVRYRLPAARCSEVLGRGSGNGVNLSRVSGKFTQSQARSDLQLPPDSVVIGYVGRMTRDKGVADLLSIFIQLQQMRPTTHLLLSGDSEPVDSLSPADWCLIEDHPGITWTGRIEDPSLAYAAMDILAFASYREGLPNVPIEAQYCGVPIVAYASTGTVDAIAADESGSLVPVGDTHTFLQSLLSLVDDAEKRERFGSFGASWVRHEFDQERLWNLLGVRYASWLNAAKR